VGFEPARSGLVFHCPDAATNAVICWHTEYMNPAVDRLREVGREVDAQVLARIFQLAARP
jgi:hypothetical protein